MPIELGTLKMRQLISFITERFAPGYGSFLVMRKKYIEEKVTDFLKAYPDAQVVNIGSGLDTLISRLAKKSTTNTFIEIDYPVVINFKRPLCVYKNIEFIGCDLSEKPIEDVLKNTSFDSAKPVLFMLEGVLMYLPENVAFELLRSLSRLSSDKTAVIFSSMLEDENEELFSQSARNAMKRNNSALLWAKDREPLKESTLRSGFTITEQKGHVEFAEQFKSQVPKPKNFCEIEYYNWAEVE